MNTIDLIVAIALIITLVIAISILTTKVVTKISDCDFWLG
jgi:hypothetical protein